MVTGLVSDVLGRSFQPVLGRWLSLQNLQSEKEEADETAWRRFSVVSLCRLVPYGYGQRRRQGESGFCESAACTTLRAVARHIAVSVHHRERCAVRTQGN